MALLNFQWLNPARASVSKPFDQQSCHSARLLAVIKIKKKCICSHVIFIFSFKFWIKNAGGDGFNQFLMNIPSFWCITCLCRFNLPFLYSSIKKKLKDSDDFWHRICFRDCLTFSIVKTKMEISSNFMAFSEYINFTLRRMRIYLRLQKIWRIWRIFFFSEEVVTLMTYGGLLLIQHLQKLEKIVKDSNADLTVENWNFKILP